MIYDLEFKSYRKPKSGRLNHKPGVLPVSITKLFEPKQLDFVINNTITKDINSKNLLESNHGRI